MDNGVDAGTGALDGHGPGARLREVRERRGMSRDAVARSLRLDARVIDALEADDYAALPAPLFVKGYLNAYCRLLGLSPREVLAAYERGAGRAPPPPLKVGARQGDQVTSSHARIVFSSWIIGLLALAMVVLWWLSRPPGAPEVARTPVPVSKEPAGGPQQATATAPAQERAQERAQVARLVLGPDEAPEPGAGQDLPAGWLRVTATFTGDCWTEITDVDGRRLYFALARAGQTIEIEGQGPFQVFLGNSPAAAFEVNGRPFDHSSYTRAGDIARFSIEEEQDP